MIEEIRGSPVEVLVVFSRYLHDFICPRWVVWDFFPLTVPLDSLKHLCFFWRCVIWVLAGGKSHRRGWNMLETNMMEKPLSYCQSMGKRDGWLEGTYIVAHPHNTAYEVYHLPSSFYVFPPSPYDPQRGWFIEWFIVILQLVAWLSTWIGSTVVLHIRTCHRSS